MAEFVISQINFILWKPTFYGEKPLISMGNFPQSTVSNHMKVRERSLKLFGAFWTWIKIFWDDCKCFVWWKYKIWKFGSNISNILGRAVFLDYFRTWHGNQNISVPLLLNQTLFLRCICSKNCYQVCIISRRFSSIIHFPALMTHGHGYDNIFNHENVRVKNNHYHTESVPH